MLTGGTFQTEALRINASVEPCMFFVFFLSVSGVALMVVWGVHQLCMKEGTLPLSSL